MMSEKTITGLNGRETAVNLDSEPNKMIVPSTGRLLHWRPINIQNLRRQCIRRLEQDGVKQPDPPEVEVKIGRSAGYEPDYNDPSFRKAYAIWIETVSERMMTAVYTALASWQPFGDKERHELDGYKSAFGDLIAFGDDDRFDWFMQFIVGNDGDTVFNVVTGREHVTEAGIEREKKDS